MPSQRSWWDGTGYPLGLEREDIPVEGRIAAVADVFDALTSDRPYRGRLSFAAAREHLESERGRAFDPAVVDAFFGSLSAFEPFLRLPVRSELAFGAR